MVCRHLLWGEKQELLARKATENDQMQQKHLLSKMKSSYGRTKY